MKIIRGNSVSFVPASHEPADDPNVFKKVLANAELLNAGQVQMINWAKMPVGRAFCAHFHEDMQEIFVILKGSAFIDVAGQQDELSSGDIVIIEPCEVHVMTNTSEVDLEYIAIGISSGQGGKTIVV